jgi:hypothetical protein
VFVVGPSRGARVADLGDGHDVEGVVEPTVSRPGEPVTLLLPGGYVDRRGPVVGGEVVLGLEAVDVADLGEDAPGDDRPDPVKVGQCGSAVVDQVADPRSDGLDLLVDAADLFHVAERKGFADLGHLVAGSDPAQQGGRHRC